ncbi:MAG: prephenate dehydrogenase/arogenate dehydrogenase family protein [Phycisphaeraceae bacterium]
MQSLHTGQVTIVGTGLLGGSVGLALRAQGFTGTIVGVGRREQTLEAAKQCGCIDRGTTTLAEGVADADLVILATPVSVILSALAEIAPVLSPEAVVTDVGSTKQSIVARAEAELQHPSRFVGSHPMAGGAQTGPEAGDADLFTGKPVIVTPTDRTDADALEQVEGLWSDLGMRLSRMTPEAHDVAVARISHMPHAAALMLVNLAKAADLEVASTGFENMTHAALGDPNMWADIFLDNAEAVTQVLSEWRELWDGFEQIVRERDRAGMLKLLQNTQQTRHNWQQQRRPNSGA